MKPRENMNCGKRPGAACSGSKNGGRDGDSHWNGNEGVRGAEDVY